MARVGRVGSRPEMAREFNGPWVDVHAHPGRCFLAGLDPDDALAAALGGAGCDVAMADLSAAGMAAVSFSTVADLRVIGVADDGSLHIVRPFEIGEAYADHVRQLDALVGLAARHGRRIIRVAADIVDAHARHEPGLLITCEGADFVEDRVERLTEAYELGVRSVTLVHYRPNELGDVQTSPPVHGGLTDAGRRAVRAMNDLGILIDLAHATYDTTIGALLASNAPVMISHSHLNGPTCEHARLLSRDHARAVASAGGLIGAWPAGVCCTDLEDFVVEILRLIEVVGVEHVAIGTDLDANYRPVLTAYDQFATIGDRLQARGLARPEIDRILGGNAVELIHMVCG